MKVVTRREEARDVASVRAVNRAAFETSAEADLVDVIRDNGNASVSLVAVDGSRVVGHILFSPMSFERTTGTVKPLGLAPMAVIPELQRSGIGSRLVEDGLDECRAIGCQAVFVLGHPEYYPKFGFVPASRFGIHTRYDVPDEVFMAIELVPGSLDGHEGEVRYSREFDDLDA